MRDDDGEGLNVKERQAWGGSEGCPPPEHGELRVGGGAVPGAGALPRVPVHPTQELGELTDLLNWRVWSSFSIFTGVFKDNFYLIFTI